MLADTLTVINADQVVAVIFNSHSTAPVIDQIVGAAAARDIPVAGISATLPAGKDYLGWVDDAIANQRSFDLVTRTGWPMPSLPDPCMPSVTCRGRRRPSPVGSGVRRCPIPR